jgi:glycosyltransferase involved in cell wall biosynthesis
MTLHYAIDSVAVNDRMLFGWGWCFSDCAAQAEVQLKLEYADGSIEWLQCQSNITRVDVLASYPSTRHSVSSGFRFAAKLKSEPVAAKVYLYLMMHDGSWKNTQVPDFFSWDNNGSMKGRAERKKITELRDFFERIRPARSQLALLVDHAMGGGANMASERWSGEWLDAGNALLTLRFNVSRLEYVLQFRDVECSQSISFENFKHLILFLDKVRLSQIEVNSLVSYPDVAGVLKFIVRQKAKKGLVVNYYIHDFHSLCDSWSLLNQHESFCELPASTVCEKCMTDRSGVFPVLREPAGINGWRSQWRKFLIACDSIRFFSDSSRWIFQRVYKNTVPSCKFLVRPHDKLSNLRASVHPVLENPLVIGVIGNISIAKGANVLRDMARLILKQQLPVKIVVIGNVETYEPSDAYFSTGSYTREELPGLLEKYHVGICFLPSICPETFSFVISEVMQLQFPLACFDLGAQAERVSNYDHGFIIDKPTAEAALSRILGIMGDLKTDSNIIAVAKKADSNPIENFQA